MNKYEALIITGRLEVLVQEQEQLLNEVVKLQKCIMEDDLVTCLISFDRIRELYANCDVNARDNLEALERFFSESIGSLESENELLTDMAIEELNIPVRPYNALKKAGINTVGELLLIPKSELYVGKVKGEKMWHFGRKSYWDVIKTLENKGLFLKD